MKLKYLRELFGHGQQYGCNDYSCSPPVNPDKSAENIHIPPSKHSIPFDYVEIGKGSIVVNLVSNLGYEILEESKKTGAKGKVIGVDFSSTMMYRARYNVEKNGCKNVSFREVSSSKFLPLGANISDALIFNRLTNRIPNENLFSEIYRTLKPGGVFYIYDIVLNCLIRFKADICCRTDYIRRLKVYGFKNIEI
ncbi:MAG: methyltransferase domain-containing protein [Prevotellaceae bacterium]|jgi:SAM-dependent methyltransferase|nr:methyltransferase domain-containing protein [Prevotellaceae bacterium]